MSGMEMADLSRAVWRKSSRSSGNGGACVEATPAGGAVAVRDSKNPDRAHLTVTARQWEAFARSIKAGRIGC